MRVGHEAVQAVRRRLTYIETRFVDLWSPGPNTEGADGL